MDDNGTYVKFDVAGYRGFVLRNLETALRECLARPDEFLDAGQIIKDSRSTRAGIVTLKDRTKIFLKRYNNKSLRYTLRYLFRPTRPFRVLNAAIRLQELDIPTPRVLAAVGRRNWRLYPQEAFVVNECFDGLYAPREYFPLLKEDNALREQFAAAICGCMAKLHNSGIRHGDLKLSNIFCRKTAEGLRFGLWDLDGVRIYRGKLPPVYIYEEMGRLVSAWLKTAAKLNFQEDREEINRLFIGKYSAQSDFKFSLDKLNRRIDRFLGGTGQA